MSSEVSKLPEDIADQLSSLDKQENDGLDELSFLDGIRNGIRSLVEMSDGDTDSIRALMKARRDSGDLRQETFELVDSMLARYASEHQPTADADEASEDDEFSSTTVLSPDLSSTLARDKQLQVGSVLRDRFLLQEKVSGGSMGVVYKALDRRLAETGVENPYVAIKVISPALAQDAKALRALQQEAAKGRCLTHDHIVRFIDLDRDDELYFIVMEWLDGENLADMLDRSKKFSADKALKITRQIGRAADYAHRCGIVHADIKPANIMILPDGNATLFDFGIARVRQKQDEDAFDPGELGAITPAYSSMQVLTGDEPVPEDDVFSLACLYYRLIAGYRVFGPRNAAEAAEEGMSPQPLQGISEAQWKAVKKALSFSRVTRFSSVRDFLEALEPAQGEEAIAADPEERVFVEDNLPGSRRAPWFALAVIVGIAAAYLSGVLDPYIASFTNGVTDVTEAGVAASIVDEPDAVNPESESSAPEIEGIATETDVEPAEAPMVENAIEPTDDPVAVVEPRPALPPADVDIVLDGINTERSLSLREGDAPITVEARWPSLSGAESRLLLTEASFSGNRSPLQSGEVVISPGLELVADPATGRVRFSLALRDDPVREADQQLQLQLFGSLNQPLAMLQLDLQDDDQRRFEASLPANTVAFPTGQISVAEREAAVQIDVIRFSPDDQPLSISFTIGDVTATADEDYFAPANNVIEFAPGQRSARIIVPLVQDSTAEGNEAFVLELISANTVSDTDIYQRVAIMIRDDD